MSTPVFPQLQAFLAIARLRSFSGAARELGVTRSAASQAVRRLEDELHVVLLTRTIRSDLERGRKSRRIPVRGGVVTNDHLVRASLAIQGVGLTCAFEPAAKAHRG